MKGQARQQVGVQPTEGITGREARAAAPAGGRRGSPQTGRARRRDGQTTRRKGKRTCRDPTASRDQPDGAGGGQTPPASTASVPRRPTSHGNGRAQEGRRTHSQEASGYRTQPCGPGSAQLRRQERARRTEGQGATAWQLGHEQRRDHAGQRAGAAPAASARKTRTASSPKTNPQRGGR